MRMNFLRCQLKGEILTENILTGAVQGTLQAVVEAVQASPFFLPRLWILTTRWYTWSQSQALELFRSIYHSHFAVVPQSESSRLSAGFPARQWHIVLCSQIRSYKPKIALLSGKEWCKIGFPATHCSSFHSDSYVGLANFFFWESQVCRIIGHPRTLSPTAETCAANRKRS